MSNKPAQVIVFCPLPPKPNGIADYFAEQLPYLTDEVSVTVVIENTHPDPVGINASVTLLRLEEYLWRVDEFSHIPHIYHVGNNPDTTYMLPVLLSKPGLVVIHDLNLHYLIDLTNLSRGDKLGYELALANNYGEVGAIIGKQLADFGWKGKFMPQELTMNGSIVLAAERIIVHSKYSADKIAALGHANIRVVPHHFSPVARKYQAKLKLEYRRELGLPENKPIITSMGFIAKAKQIKAVLSALVVLKKSGLDFIYLLAGQCKPHEYDVYQDIADSGLSENVVVTGFLDEDAFFKYMLSSDCIVNLRYPSGGETSGTLTRAMGMGLCCVVVNIGPFAEIPDDCAVKLDWDDSFQESLVTQLSRLIGDVHYRVSIGKKGQKWIERTHNIRTTTQAYLEEAMAVNDATRLDQKSLGHTTRTYLSDNLVAQRQIESENYSSHKLLVQSNLLPINEPKLLIVSDHSQQLAKLVDEIYGYRGDKVDCLGLSQIRTTSISYLSSCSVVEVSLSDLSYNPVHWFASVNKLLAIGGKLVLVLQVEQCKSVEFSLDRSSLKKMLVAAGFAVERVVAGPLDVDMFASQGDEYSSDSQQALQEYWLFSATKRSWMVNINPSIYNNGMSELKWLYPEATSTNVTACEPEERNV